MEKDFIDRYGGDDPNRRDLMKHLYREVVADLLQGLHHPYDQDLSEEEILVRSVASQAIRYAREFSYSMVAHLAETRQGHRRSELIQTIERLEAYRAQRAAERELKRQDELRARHEARHPKRRKKNAT